MCVCVHVSVSMCVCVCTCGWGQGPGVQGGLGYPQDSVEAEYNQSLLDNSLRSDQRGVADVIETNKDDRKLGLAKGGKPVKAHKNGGYLLGFGHLNQSGVNLVREHADHPSTIALKRTGVPHCRKWHEDMPQFGAVYLTNRANDLFSLGVGKTFIEVYSLD